VQKAPNDTLVYVLWARATPCMLWRLRALGVDFDRLPVKSYLTRTLQLVPKSIRTQYQLQTRTQRIRQGKHGFVLSLIVITQRRAYVWSLNNAATHQRIRGVSYVTNRAL